MKVKGIRTEYNVEIEIDPENMINSIFDYCNMKRNYYVKDNKIYYDEEYYGGTHSWDETKLISDKSNDVELLNALKTIYNYIWEKKYNGNV